MLQNLAIWKFDIAMNGKISGASLRKILSFATCGLLEGFLVQNRKERILLRHLGNCGVPQQQKLLFLQDISKYLKIDYQEKYSIFKKRI